MQERLRIYGYLEKFKAIFETYFLYEKRGEKSCDTVP
jgi:hypothetical protein